MDRLPEVGGDWPLPEVSPLLPKYEEWEAWYQGSTKGLASFYSGARGHAVRPSVRQVGVFGVVQRFFWGQGTTPGHPRTKLHVPIAADISSASADLLFGEEVGITSDFLAGTGDRQRLDYILEENRWGSLMLEGADMASAFGSVYLRVVWDQNLTDVPIISVVPADQAIPSFRWGRLSSVCFWQEVKVDGQRIWRHLELHAPGFIEHALYEGTSDKLGRRVPLTESGLTADIDVNEDGVVETGTPLLTTVHIPNMRPVRCWRKDPLGVNLGRSDYDGVEPLMDSLDETWTSWMRDIRLAKGRILASQAMLRGVDQERGRGPSGGGSVIDLEQEVYTPLRLLDVEGKPLLEMHQFAIRANEHEQTANALMTQIFRGAGYSAQTFGLVEAGAPTATEIDAREARSFNTRQKKAQYWSHALAQFLRAVLHIDQFVFNQGPGPLDDIKVEFPDPTPSTRELSQTLQLLESAKAVSTKTKVQMLHPDWDEEAVNEEVDRIEGAAAASYADELGVEQDMADALSLGEPVRDWDYGQETDS